MTNGLILLLIALVHPGLSEKIVLPEWQNTKGAANHTITIEKKVASIHFRKVGEIAHAEETAFMSFRYHLKPLILKSYLLSQHCNLTHEIASQNLAFKKAANITLLYAAQASQLYQDLKNTLLTWETQDPNNLAPLLEVDQKIKEAGRRLHPSINGKYTKADYLEHLENEKAMLDISSNKTKRSTSRRDRRQVVAGLIGAGALAGVSYVADKLGLTDLIGLRDNTADKLHVAVANVNHRFDADEKRQRNLEHELYKVTQAEEELISRGIFTRLLESLDAHLEDVRAEVQAAIRGMSSLLLKELSPDLIPFEIVREGLKLLEVELHKNNLVPILDTIASIFSLPASHVLDHHTLEIFVVIRVPVQERTNRLTLYHYVDFPASIGRGQYIIPQPDYDFIAVNNIKSTFKELKSGDLLLCEKTPNLYICPLHSVNVKSDETCLVALFKGKGDMINRLCPSKSASRDMVLQRQDNVFQVYFHNMQTLTFSCHDSHNVLTRSFAGTRQVTLPYGCKAESHAFSFSAKAALHGHLIPIRVHQIPYFNIGTAGKDDQILTTVNNLESDIKKTAMEDRSNIQQAKKGTENIEFDSYRHIPMISLAVLGLITLVLAVIYICCWCRREIRAFQMAGNNLPHGDHELQPMNNGHEVTD